MIYHFLDMTQKATSLAPNLVYAERELGATTEAETIVVSSSFGFDFYPQRIYEGFLTIFVRSKVSLKRAGDLAREVFTHLPTLYSKDVSAPSKPLGESKIHVLKLQSTQAPTYVGEDKTGHRYTMTYESMFFLL